MLRADSQHLIETQQPEHGSYTRKQMCRLLRIDERDLRNWERKNLIATKSEFRFGDLLRLKTIIRLRSEQVPVRRIKQALTALETRLKDLPNLFEDTRIYKDGKHVRVQIGKHRMETVSGQLVFDFAENEIGTLLQLPPADRTSELVAQSFKQKMEADYWFERGLELEQIGAPIEQIIEAYEKASDLDPTAAGARVNLGTIFFQGHAWADAEQQYKKALSIDPEYALAHFNLGNLYDEQGDVPNAITHYQAALRLHPSYADAHYNLALLNQSNGDLLSALRHWRAYLKIDGASHWAQIARRELAKLEAATVISGSRLSAIDITKR